jgi:hypothetical protein
LACACAAIIASRPLRAASPADALQVKAAKARTAAVARVVGIIGSSISAGNARCSVSNPAAVRPLSGGFVTSAHNPLIACKGVPIPAVPRRNQEWKSGIALVTCSGTI